MTPFPRENGQAGGGREVEEGIDDVEEAFLLDQNPITERLCAAARRRFRGADSRCAAPNPAAASLSAAATAGPRTKWGNGEGFYEREQQEEEENRGIVEETVSDIEPPGLHAVQLHERGNVEPLRGRRRFPGRCRGRCSPRGCRCDG